MTIASSALVVLPVVAAVVAAVVVAVVGWLRRASGRRSRPATDEPPTGGARRIDPFVLSEPWRRHVQAALSAERRFRETVAGTRDGPLKDRLRDLGVRVHHSVEQSWQISVGGDEIDAAIARTHTGRAAGELARLRAQVGVGGAETPEIRSLQAHVDATSRMQRVADDARDRLRLLDVRLDELVARAAEVSVGAADSDVLDHDVDELVIEMESLRLALDDTRRLGAGNSDVVAQAGEQEPQTRPRQ